MFRNETRFLCLLFPLIAGLLIQFFFPLPTALLICFFSLSVASLIFFHNLSFIRSFGIEWVAGVCVQLALFSFGRMIMVAHQDSRLDQSPGYAENQSSTLLLRLLTDPVPKQHTLKCVALATGLIKNQDCFIEREKLLVYFKMDPNVQTLTAGSVILIRKKLVPISNTGVPGFDYKKYCRLRHIYVQAFLARNDFEQISGEKDKTFTSRLAAWREKLLMIIKKHIPRKSENSLLEALMVGFTDDLDPGLLKSYADTGVIHIIAISGLHLALICQMLQLGFNRMGKKKAGRWIKFILLVNILWTYSLLSGASPSVIRAAMMFSLALFAGCIRRETVFYNTLAASAFLLLCYDPYWIWDTGFQLSFAAVLSLRLFAKPIRNLIPLKNKMLQAIWEAASVSIAAQLLTTPVSLYYFHRFPTYFLVANLLAVPISSAILIGGILLCCCSAFPPAAESIGWMLGYIIRMLNSFIQHLSAWPGAVISPLSLNLLQVLLVYIIVFIIYRWVYPKKIR